VLGKDVRRSLVVRRLAVKQASVQFSARLPREVFPTVLTGERRLATDERNA
jgi:hypothetical protein